METPQYIKEVRRTNEKSKIYYVLIETENPTTVMDIRVKEGFEIGSN